MFLDCKRLRRHRRVLGGWRSVIPDRLRWEAGSGADGRHLLAVCGFPRVLVQSCRSLVVLQSCCNSNRSHGDSGLCQGRLDFLRIRPWLVELWRVPTGLRWDCLKSAIPAQSTEIARVFGGLRSEHLEIALIWSWIVDHPGCWCSPCDPLRF